MAHRPITTADKAISFVIRHGGARTAALADHLDIAPEMVDAMLSAYVESGELTACRVEVGGAVSLEYRPGSGMRPYSHGQLTPAGKVGLHVQPRPVRVPPSPFIPISALRAMGSADACVEQAANIVSAKIGSIEPTSADPAPRAHPTLQASLEEFSAAFSLIAEIEELASGSEIKHACDIPAAIRQRKEHRNV